MLLPSISDLDELSRIRTLLEYALEGGTYAYLKDLLQSMSEAIPGSHPNCYLRFGRQL